MAVAVEDGLATLQVQMADQVVAVLWVQLVALVVQQAVRHKGTQVV